MTGLVPKARHIGAVIPTVDMTGDLLPPTVDLTGDLLPRKAPVGLAGDLIQPNHGRTTAMVTTAIVTAAMEIFYTGRRAITMATMAMEIFLCRRAITMATIRHSLTITGRRTMRGFLYILRHVPDLGQLPLNGSPPLSNGITADSIMEPRGGPGVFGLGLTCVVWRGLGLRGYIQDSKSVVASFWADQCVKFEATTRWKFPGCHVMHGGRCTLS